ncbi:ornithine carbamoyltransferase [Variovorax sp. H27-G14]|uniref:ornithine carbamoyltransferase n=1 Tax=Variovorax sp. H27-G14 TaxID=3111914 RepID=UPI0038FCE9CF
MPAQPRPLPQTQAQAADLIALALWLRQLARGGALPQLLRARNIALLCDGTATQDPAPLLRAARELGAHVATVRWSLSGAGKQGEVLHTGRMLGRLYDGVVCQGMPAALVSQIAQAAGVPVWDDIASDEHPSAGLVDELEKGLEKALGDASCEETVAGDNRRFVLQALLVDGLA